MSGVTQPDWRDDERLLEDLAEALREVAPSARTIAAHAELALSWRTVDDDLMLAALSFDSSLEARGSTRAPTATSRVLAFSSAPLTVEIEVTPDCIVGQLLPPSVGEVHVETADGTTIGVRADEMGFFVVSGLHAGPVRLRCDTPTGRVVTEWVTL